MTTARRHAMLPRPTHDERVRQAFVRSFRRHLASRVMPGNYPIYAARVEPRFRAETGRSPQAPAELRAAMERDPYYQFWSAMLRRSQELMWESVIDPAERDREALIRRARSSPKGRGKRKGSLVLDPSLPTPRYHAAADIHLQPGGYHTDFGPDDITAGAVYDSGLHLYLDGAFGVENDAMGDILLAFYRHRFPGLKPARILDMGCAIGNSTLPWGRAFPRAELHAIDVGAPVLRYGHARAEALGVPVHFSQQNAEATNFKAGSFDLIVSHIMLHETSKSALSNILRECRRLLKPGGIMLHLEIPRGTTPLEKFMYNWESYNNNETFAQFLTDADLAAIAARSGFAPDAVEMVGFAPREAGAQTLYSPKFIWTVLVGRP
jgi:ubiquinone/menaquinone biosynthesis C-methylase UbiE